MDPDITPDAAETEGVPQTPRPRLRDYLWRSRVARLWWAGAVVYWAGFALSFQIEPLADFYHTAIAGYLNVLFYPFTIVMALGVPFVWAKLDRGDWVITAPSHEEMFPPRSVGGMRDPASDPLDPRSGILHWRHFHPDN